MFEIEEKREFDLGSTNGIGPWWNPTYLGEEALEKVKELILISLDKAWILSSSMEVPLREKS